jgi:NADH dehydrogenase
LVEKVDGDGVVVDGKRIASATVLWTAGVAPAPIVKLLGGQTDRAGRVSVGPFLNLQDVPGVFVVGDASSVVRNGRPVPGVAQAAIQQGRYVGRLIARQLKGRTRSVRSATSTRATWRSSARTSPSWRAGSCARAGSSPGWCGSSFI